MPSKSVAETQIFGVRHHGPGSAARLVAALDALAPATVLIEGPADLTPLLPLLASPQMVPPVALLAYPTDNPAQAAFWPFAAFSPEYQAARWAAAHGAAARFIDLPTAWRMRPREDDAALVDLAPEGPPADTAHQKDTEEETVQPPSDAQAAAPAGAMIERDPIGVLASAAGYEDGESWWRDVIEENPSPGPVFAAVADAMGALRAHAPAPCAFEAAREAHMRLEIAKAAKESDGPVAVVCGAWHAPALAEKTPAKADRALLKGAPKRKISATWAPWTSPRLALASGYGAGVDAPGWCAHLWRTGDARDGATRWIAKIAAALREEGQIVSTASLIETERLAVSLAALRGRPRPGFEELREAAIACLCFGAPLLWSLVADRVLIGSEVGAIPEDAPLAPLLDDLQRQQKAARLKPEALRKEVSLDLRSESGLFRSTLLHRLSVLDVGWGQLGDAGRSRGTFRERWILEWRPEYAVALVENLVHGPTIERAAHGRLTAALTAAENLPRLADLVFSALTAQLPAAAEKGVALLGARAGRTSDGPELLGALPQLAEVLRYGGARAVDLGQLGDLFARIAVQGALALPHAARGLDAAAAELLRATMRAADAAIRLMSPGSDAASGPEAAWAQALRQVSDDPRATRLLAGTAARLLYEADALRPDAAAALLARMLSPGTPVADAAGFFAGFFEGGGQRLIYDAPLRRAVDGWISSLDAEAFTEHLPLFRRVFSDLDKMERKRLLEAALSRGGGAAGALRPVPGAEAIWPAHFDRIVALMGAGGADD